MGPGWSHVSKGGRIVKTTPTEAKQSETIAQAGKVTEVTPRTLSNKHSASTTHHRDSLLATIKDLAKDIPLSFLTGVIAHVMREEHTYPKGEGRPRPILTSILLYLVNHWKRQMQNTAPNLLQY